MDLSPDGLVRIGSTYRHDESLALCAGIYCFITLEVEWSKGLRTAGFVDWMGLSVGNVTICYTDWFFRVVLAEFVG